MLIAARNAMMVGGGWKNPYVTDGCILNFNAVWNAGGGKHDANATAWIDLMGGASLTIPSTLSISADSLYTIERSNISMSIKTPSAIVDAINSMSMTIEFVVKNVMNSNSANGLLSIFSSSSIRPLSCVAIPASSNSIFRYQDGILGTSSNTSGSMVVGALSDPYRVSIASTFFNGGAYHYRNGGLQETVSITMNQSGAATTNMDLNFLRHPTAAPGFNGEICAIRISRALTADEIAANYAVDRALFNLP